MATSTLMTEQPLTIPMQKGEHLMDITVNPGVVVGPSSTTMEQYVSLFEQINMTVFWIASNFLGGSLTTIIISSMVAKYFGDANKDINLAQVIAITMSGVLLQLLHGLPNHLAYTVVFGTSIVCFALGTLVIRQVKGAR